MDCPKCGGTIDEGAEYCSHCGTRLVPENPSMSSQKRLRIAIIVLASTLVVALAVLGVIAFSASDDETSTAGTPTSTVEPTETPAATSTAESEEAPSSEPESPGGTAAAGEGERGYQTAEEALRAYLPEDVSYVLLYDYGPEREYATAPPESDYTETVIVARQADGSWRVVGTRDLEPGEPGNTIADQAEAIVTQYVNSAPGDGDAARAVSLEANDDWLDSVSGGWATLWDWRILTTNVEDDGTTVTVNTLEGWWMVMDDIAYFRSYTCVPTADGYRILHTQTIRQENAEDLFPEHFN